MKKNKKSITDRINTILQILDKSITDDERLTIEETTRLYTELLQVWGELNEIVMDIA